MDDNKNNKHYIRLERHKWPDEVAKERNKRKNIIITILVGILLFTSGFTLSTVLNYKNTTKVSESNSKKFEEIYSTMINEWYYANKYDDLENTLLDNAIKGMLENEYDSHTNYYDEEESKSFMESLDDSFVGIGISYTSISGNIVIERVYNDSPAKEAGIEPGDILTKIDGQSVEGMDTSEVKELATGEEGSSVTVEVLRDNKTKTFDMVRRSIGTTVYGYEKNKVGILEIDSFAENSAEQVESYLKTFKEDNINKLVIDLRGNGGGYLTTMIDIASFFMDEGTVCLQEEDNEGNITKYKAESSNHYNFNSIVMLVDEDTASASEALTACMQENIGAKVVGVTTYGKGTVQQPITFDDDTIFKYTVAEWLTPEGNKINKKGIKPDYKVTLDEAITFVPEEDDNTYKVDSVGDGVKNVQVYLKFLGYSVDRTDGYFSQSTLSALKQYQSDNNLKADGIIDSDLYTNILSSAQKYYYDNKDTLDTQLKKAIEVANGK